MAVPVKIYTRKWCGYCTAAERLLTKKGIRYENLDVSNDPETRKWLILGDGADDRPADLH